MNAADIIKELKSKADPKIRNVMMNHGAGEQQLGVKVADLKVIQKRIKKDYKLSLQLYDSGIGDAMYLAGLIADAEKMTPKDLQHWADTAPYDMIREYTVAGTAADGPHGAAMARKWIESNNEHIATCGWSTWSGVVAVVPDEQLDMAELKQLLKRVETTIHQQPDRVRYVMNNFVISAGCYVKALTPIASAAAKKIGKVKVDMHGTACKVPDALEYFHKVGDRGSIGKKRKSARC